MSTAYLMDGINMMFGIYSQQSSISSKLKQQLTYIEENRIGDITDAYYGAKALTNLANTALGAVGAAIGVNLTAAGFTGEIAGAGVTATGIGAAIGIPAMAVSADLAAAGAVAVGHGISMSYTALNNFQNNAKKISSNSQTGAGNKGAGNGSSKSWGNESTLQDHFERHGSDFGAKSPNEYAQKANEFYNNKSKYQVKVDENGVIRVYDPRTNTFGSYNSDGTTRTFYKPTGGQNYFNSQPGK